MSHVHSSFSDQTSSLLLNLLRYFCDGMIVPPLERLSLPSQKLTISKGGALSIHFSGMQTVSPFQSLKWESLAEEIKKQP